MAMEPVEFGFEDLDKQDFKVEVEGRASEKEVEVEVPEDKKPEVEIEIVDDTPPQDRGRKPSDPPEDPTDEELEGYSEKVRKRMSHLTKGYHDERRAKETAFREREEAIRYAQQILEENKNLKGTVGKNQEALLEQAKRSTATEVEQAKAKYKIAYESGDSDAVVAAQDELTAAKIKADRVNNFKLPPVQTPEVAVQQQQTTPNQPQVDEKAVNWQKQNSWFGSDDEMTSFALGLHQKLVKQGLDPRSDEYYEKINSRMRQVFPDEFDDAEEVEVEKPKQKSNVVAPATRSTAPKKIVLTPSSVALAKRLGVPLEEYAKQVALGQRK
jgi:hypothetical protein